MIVHELNIKRFQINKLFKYYSIKKKTRSEIQLSKVVKNKIKETCLKLYNKTSYLATDECKKILNDKYNVQSNIFQSDEIKEKSRKTKLEKYGDANYCNIEKIKKPV